MRRLRLNDAFFNHAFNHFNAQLGAHDGERPAVVLANASGGDVCMFSSEVGAALAAFACPLMAFLQIDLMERTIVHPDLEGALDVHLHHVLLLQAVLGFKQLREDGIVECLAAQKTNVELEWL